MRVHMYMRTRVHTCVRACVLVVGPPRLHASWCACVRVCVLVVGPPCLHASWRGVRVRVRVHAYQEFLHHPARRAQV